MAGIGVCSLDDLALSVVATVIGHRREKGWIITDAGWMALSRDRGTAAQAVDQGYGLVASMEGEFYPDLQVGTRVRIYPNHACATAAQFDRYHVIEPGGTAISGVWPRFGGW